jgi:hypothetical protein
MSKGQGQKALGGNSIMQDAMRDAMTDNPRLAAARAGEDKNGAAAIRDGPLLLRVELVE